MKICVYGAGVIGSIFAGKLALAGNDVTVIDRGKRLDEIRKSGIILVDSSTNKSEKIAVEVAESLSPHDNYDYNLVVLQRTQVDDILPLLSQNCSGNIVFAVNTAGGYEKWANAVGAERLMIGFPSAGGEYKDGKIYYFIGKGIQRAFQTTTFGEYSRKKTARVNALIDLFNQAGIPSVYCSDMDAWQKTHVALVTSIANALYGFDCDNVKLGHSYSDVKDMITGIKEGRRVLRHNGISPTPQKLWWCELPTPLLAAFFTLLMRTKLAETTMAKHSAVARPEMVLLQQEFDTLIQKSGMATPAIDKLKKNLD